MTESAPTGHDWQVTDNQGHSEECANGCGASWYLFDGVERHPGPCPAAGACTFCGAPGFRVGFGRDRICVTCARTANVDGNADQAQLRVAGCATPWVTMTSLGGGHDARAFLSKVIADIAGR